MTAATLTELANFARRATPPSRDDRRVEHRVRIAQTQVSRPIVAAPTPSEAKARAAVAAEAFLQHPEVRRQLRESGIKLPPLRAGGHRQAVSTAPFTLPVAQPRVTSPSAPVRSPFTPKEALAALNEMREDIRDRKSVV